jgi:transposase
MPAGLVRRARIVLLAADGVPVTDIVERVGASKPTVIAWRKRYAAEGVGAPRACCAGSPGPVCRPGGCAV